MARMVTIKGTWTRKDTYRAEVYDWRTTFRRLAQRYGGSLEYTLPQSQKDEGVYPQHAGTKSGTFIADVPLRNNYHTRRQNAKAALKVVEAILALETCRPPTLRLDWDATELRRDDSVAPVL
jgi:hypothetical protein